MQRTFLRAVYGGSIQFSTGGRSDFSCCGEKKETAGDTSGLLRLIWNSVRITSKY